MEVSGDLRGKRILLVGNDPEYFLMHRLMLANALTRMGVDLHVALPYQIGDARFVGHQFALHRLNLKRGNVNPMLEVRVLFELAKLLRRLRPDLVHHVTLKPVLYGSAIARIACVEKVVNSVTGLGFVFSSNSTIAKFLRLFVLPGLRFGCNRPQVRMLFENSDDAAVYCASKICNLDNCSIVPSSGVDPDVFAPHVHEKGNVTVLFLGRMLWDKGIGEFVEAAREIHAIRPFARFVMVGSTDPNPESIPAETLRAWNEERFVEYWGWRSDIVTLLRDVDILCLPSYREGLPRALLEGGAAGLALVTTDVPGCRDAVRAGETAFVVPAKNSKALGEALLLLIDDHDLRARMGAAARQDVKDRFSVESVIGRTCQIYSDVLGDA